MSRAPLRFPRPAAAGLFAALILAAAAQPGAPQAQITPVTPTGPSGPQPTAQGAHSFLTQILGNGATSFDGLTTSGDDFAAWAKINSVISYGCTTSLYAVAEDNGKRVNRRIDWSKVQDVHQSYDYGHYTVQVVGSITTTNGSQVSNLLLAIDDETTRDRVVRAGLFLRDACDTSRNTGF